MRAFVCYILLVSLFALSSLHAQQSTWELMRDNFFGQIAVDPKDSDIIYVYPGNYAGNPEFGLHKSTDGGKTWTLYTQGYEGLGNIDGMLIDSANPQRLWLYGGPFKGIVRSEDGGMTAVRADTGIAFDHHGYTVTAMGYDAKRQTLYAGDISSFASIYRSYDHGRRWETLLSYGQGVPFFDPLFFLIDEETGWIYGAGGGVWRSKDLGQTWTQLHPEVLGINYLAFLARTPDSHTLYAAGRNGKIFKSYDFGGTWSSLSNAVTDSAEFEGGFLVSTLDSNYVLAGARGSSSIFFKGGVFQSVDGGENWRVNHLGLPEYPLSNYNVWSIAQASNGKEILLSIEAARAFEEPHIGLYRLDLSKLTNVRDRRGNADSSSTLIQIYPNPSNSQTQITIHLAKPARVSLDILDINGRQIVNLLNEVNLPGNYGITWNGSNSKGGDVTSGIYICRLISGEAVFVRKLLVMR